jgi:hypothetical protein
MVLDLRVGRPREADTHRSDAVAGRQSTTHAASLRRRFGSCAPSLEVRFRAVQPTTLSTAAICHWLNDRHTSK